MSYRLKCKAIVFSLARGVVGFIIWPISSCLSAKRVMRCATDRDFREGVGFSRNALTGSQDVSKYSYESALAISRYRLTLNYILMQKITFALTLQVILPGCIPLLAGFSYPLFKVGYYLTSGLWGIACFTRPDLFECLLDVTFGPLIQYFKDDAKPSTRDIVLRAKLRTQDYGFSNNLVANNYPLYLQIKNELQQKVAINRKVTQNHRERLTKIKELLQEDTPLESNVCNIIILYSDSRNSLKLYDLIQPPKTSAGNSLLKKHKLQ